jgi:hypothetical protein
MTGARPSRSASSARINRARAEPTSSAWRITAKAATAASANSSEMAMPSIEPILFSLGEPANRSDVPVEFHVLYLFQTVKPCLGQAVGPADQLRLDFVAEPG